MKVNLYKLADYLRTIPNVLCPVITTKYTKWSLFTQYILNGKTYHLKVSENGKVTTNPKTTLPDDIRDTINKYLPKEDQLASKRNPVGITYNKKRHEMSFDSDCATLGYLTFQKGSRAKHSVNGVTSIEVLDGLIKYLKNVIKKQKSHKISPAFYEYDSMGLSDLIEAKCILETRK